jgi:hypothetical protein
MQNADSAGIFGRQTKPEKCMVCTHKKVFLSAKGSKYEGPLATPVAKHVIRCSTRTRIILKRVSANP